MQKKTELLLCEMHSFVKAKAAKSSSGDSRVFT